MTNACQVNCNDAARKRDQTVENVDNQNIADENAGATSQTGRPKCQYQDAKISNYANNTKHEGH